MAQPTASDVFVNLPLTTLSVAYMQNAANFVATQVFPTVPSDLQGHSYFKWGRQDWYRVQATYRAPGSPTAGSGMNVSTDTFFCQPYGVHKDLDDQTLATQVAPLNLEVTSTRWVTHQLLLKREKVWATNFFTTGIWTGSTTATDITPAVKWSAAGSTPVEDVDAQIVNVAKITGYRPNVMVVSPDTFFDLKNHAEILDRIKYTQTGIVTEEILAAVFGVDKFLVTYATEVTTDELASSDTYSFIGGSGQAMLAYAAPEAGLDTPSAGYTFAWTGYTGAGAEGNRIRSFRIEERQSTRIEGELAIDPHVVAADMGVFFTGLH